MPTAIAGVFVVERPLRRDSRGFFSRLFCADGLHGAGWRGPIAQVNHSFTSTVGTIRGMHFQHPPHDEMKLVNCLNGDIWDVVVDLRRGSPTFLQWHGERLSADNRRALLIPEGCAHGFQSLTDNSVLVYCHSKPHAPEAEGGVRYDDPSLHIDWPLPARNVSRRDLAYDLISAKFLGVPVG